MTKKVEGWVSVYYDLIKECRRYDFRLNDWERKFLDSVQLDIESGMKPTRKQISKLEQVHHKATRP